MATFTVTTSNWNSDAFWNGVSTSGTGQALNFSSLPASYSVTVDNFFGAITLTDGSSTFTVKDSASGVIADATMGGSSLLSHFDTIVGATGDNTSMGGGSLTFTGADRSSFTADNTSVVCFAAGTMILTDRGEVPIECLRVEDRVATMDNGLQPLAMIATRRLAAR